MLPTPLAFAWLLWRQHRYALNTVFAFLALAAAISAFLPAYCSPQQVPYAVMLTIIWIISVFLFLLGAFTYGFDGTDVLARESCFPHRLFRLPVPTHSLVLWPMIGGSVTVITLWVLIAQLLLQPWLEVLDDRVPFWWPGFFAAAALAWIQALLWSPFGLRGLRLILVAALLLALLAANISLTVVRESWLVGGYAALTMLGWAAGYSGVRFGRRGEAPNWESFFYQPFWQLARWWPRLHGPFRSAARAQLWFEYRLWGWSLPLCTGMLLIVQLMPLYFGENEVLPTQQTLLGALAAPVFLAGIFGNCGGGNNPGVKGRFGLGSFSATLPISTANMVAAMLRTAALSSLSAWAVLAIVVPFAVLVSGNGNQVAGWWQEAREQYSAAQLVTAIFAITILLMVATWKRQVDRLYFGLTGQEWIAKSVAILFFPGSIFLCIMAVWIFLRPATHDTVLAILPPLLAIVFLCKLLATFWAMREVLKRKLVQPTTMVGWAVAWVLLAAALFTMLALTIPTERVPIPYLAAGVLFAMPMARLTATPLALSWNRHR